MEERGERRSEPGSQGRPRILVGMDSVDSDGSYPAEPLALCETVLIEYPMECQTLSEAGERETVRITDEAQLGRWADREFDHHEIREL